MTASKFFKCGYITFRMCSRTFQTARREQEASKVSSRMCFHCVDENHIASETTCPARNAKCGNCGKVGHWKKVCESFSRVVYPCSANTKVNISSVISFAASISRPKVTILLDNNIRLTSLWIQVMTYRFSIQ